MEPTKFLSQLRQQQTQWCVVLYLAATSPGALLCSRRDNGRDPHRLMRALEYARMILFQTSGKGLSRQFISFIKQGRLRENKTRYNPLILNMRLHYTRLLVNKLVYLAFLMTIRIIMAGECAKEKLYRSSCCSLHYTLNINMFTWSLCCLCLSASPIYMYQPADRFWIDLIKVKLFL
jgi:hypothetical protein